MIPAVEHQGAFQLFGSDSISFRASPSSAQDQFLVPAVGVLRETGTLYPHDAEALACGRLHHDPALKAIHNFRAELLQARHFGRDVVGLDVYMDATSCSTRW